jgi:hypothetical protein
MTSYAALKMTSTMMRNKSTASAILVVTTIMLALTGCVSESSAPKASLRVYQPRVLELQAGTPVPTRNGTYIPQTDETWHSDQAYRQLEREATNAAAALAQQAK